MKTPANAEEDPDDAELADGASEMEYSSDWLCGPSIGTVQKIIFKNLEYTTESLLYLLFWGSMVAVTCATIMIYGTEFVDYPKLCEIRKISATIE